MERKRKEGDYPTNRRQRIMVLHVNQCEYGCGVVGTEDLNTGELSGEQDMEEHYKNCPIRKKWGDRALEKDVKELEAETSFVS